MNAVIAPISSLLKLTNSFSLGIKNSATYFTGKIFTQRFRHPRHIKKSEALSSYNPEYAEVQEIMRTLGFIVDRNIVFFKDFIIEYEEYYKKYSTLIITDISLYVFHGIKSTLLYFELKNLKDCNIHIVDKLNMIYLIVFYLKNGDSLFAPTKDISLCTQIFFILRELIEKK